MSGYIGAQPVPQATQHREAFTATASQTSFATVGYTPQFVDVYLNGVKLAAADYTATNGSDIVLTTGAALNDILEYVAYTPFEVASQTFTGTTTVDALVATGNVGIGTTAPSTIIDARASGVSTPSVLSLVGTNSASSQSCISQIKSLENSGGGGASDLTFHTRSVGGSFSAPAEHMRIDASGNVGIGTSSPTLSVGEGLQISKSAGAVVSVIDPDNVGSFDLLKSGNEGYLFNRGNGAILVGTNDTERMRINANGALLHGTTTAGSAGAGDIVVNGGIYLGGSVAANYLDDYEEGTWTPTVFGGTTAGTYTTGVVTGNYTKVGNLVSVVCSIQVTAFTGTGTFNVGGLPFTVGKSAGLTVQHNSNPFQTLPSTNPQVLGLPIGTNVSFRANHVTAGGAYYACLCVGGSAAVTYLRLMGTYEV